MDGALLHVVPEKVEPLKFLQDQLDLANVWRSLAIVLNRLSMLNVLK